MNDIPVYGFEPNLGGVLGLLITVALPIMVGLVTTRNVPPIWKGLLLLFLSAVKVSVEGWLEALNIGVQFNLWSLLYTLVINFVLAVGVYYGLLRAQNSSGASVATWAENRGITVK